MKMRFAIRFAAAVIAAMVLLFLLRHRWPYRLSTEKYQQILDEVMSVDFPFRSLTPNASDESMAYVHAAEQGRGLFLMDLKTLERTPAPLTNEVTQISGWSPDGRYLAFVQTPPHWPEVKIVLGNTFMKEEWITLYDRETKTCRRLTTNENVVESRFVWLNNDSYFYVVRPLAASFAEAFIGSFRNEAALKISNYMPFMDNLILTTNHVLAYTDASEIFTMNLAGLKTDQSAAIRTVKTAHMIPTDGSVQVIDPDQLSDFNAHGFSPLRWLRYNAQTASYLFCATPTNSNWRYLYRLDPANGDLTQLTGSDTYNGQFLEGGNGFAYVGNTNFDFFLCIRPQNESNSVDLFTKGRVDSYTASPQGHKVYTVAAQGIEPQGIWEYDLEKKNARLLADGINKPFVLSRVIEPKRFELTSSDGLKVPCFLYQPLEVFDPGSRDLSSRLLRKKYPAVLYVPARTSAANWTFNARMQLLANLGFYVLAVNYRGCEGYGSSYATKQNFSLAPEDLLAGYQFLKSNANTDTNRIFLSSDSDGSMVVGRLIKNNPELWRAVSMENPVFFDWESWEPQKLPPILYAVGDQDAIFRRLQSFSKWADSNRVDVTSVIYTNSGHITYKTAQRKDKLDRVGKFFVKNL